MALSQKQLQQLVERARGRGFSNERIQAALQNTLASQPVQQEEQGGFGSGGLSEFLFPLLGGIAGGAAGAAGGPVGLVAGGALGSAAGESLRQRVAGEQDVGKVLLEGGLGAIGGGVGKAVSGIGKAGIKAGIKGGAKQLATKAGQTTAGRATGRRAAAQLGSLTGTQVERAGARGSDIVGIIQKHSNKFKNLDEALGAVDKSGKAGTIQQLIQGAEKPITAVARRAGKNVRLSGQEVIDSLEAALKAESSKLGGGTRSNALRKIIGEAKTKFKGGVSVDEALKIVREGNKTFGKTLFETGKGAVTNQARKVETNALRNTLKSNFPEIAGSLDDQSELIQLREVLLKSRAGRIAGKTPASITGVLSIPLRSVTLNRAVASGFADRGIIKASETIAKGAQKIGLLPIAAGQAAAQTLGGGLVGGEAEGAPSDLPTDILSTLGAESGALAQQTQQAQPLIDRESILLAMLQDLSETGGKNLSKIQVISDFVNAGGQEGGGVELSVSQQKDFAKIGVAKTMITQFEEALNDIGILESGVLARGRGIALSISGALGTSPKVKVYNDMRKALASQLAKSLGEVGTLNEGDIQRAISAIPSVGDSVTEAAGKIEFVRKLVEAAQENIIQSASLGTGTLSQEELFVNQLGI